MLPYLVAWAAIIALTVLLMARRGHAWYFWFILSAALGPLAWPLALRALIGRDHSPNEPPVGDVLIAFPPWLRSPEPMVKAIKRAELAPRMATLVSVLDSEDADTPAGRAAAREIEALLERCERALVSAGLVRSPVEHRLLYGRAADEIARLAGSGDYRAIVLGPSGSGLRHLLRGHTRARLERLGSIPIVPPDSQRTAA